MRRSRRNHHEQENHERWLVSYADFITLLFAFFVVMYAVSSVNEGKYRVLSNVLVSAFRATPQPLEPVPADPFVHRPFAQEADRSGQPNIVAPDLRPFPLPALRQEPRPVLDHAEAPLDQVDPPQSAPAPAATAPDDPLNRVAGRLQDAMADLIRADLVTVRRRDRWVEVEIKSSMLFASGSAAISPQALEPLSRVAAIVRDIPNRIQVEGFTDNVPINTPVFPSNWELSAARAASVVHLLMKAGVRPERMTAIGYGEHRPVYDNATEDGRSLNRRVVLVVLSDAALRKHARLAGGDDRRDSGERD